MIKITKLREAALGMMVDTEWVFAGQFADRLVPSRRWWPQGATRWGCGYMQPFVDAGLVKKDSRVDCGGARYTLTDAGWALVGQIEHVRNHARDIEATAMYGQA